MYQKSKILLDCTSAAIVYLVVLLIMPLSSILFPHLEEGTVDVFLNAAITILIGTAFLGLFIYLIAKGKAARPSSSIWLFIFFIITIFFLMEVDITKNRLHFLGYGILCVFLFRALRHTIGTQMLYLYSSLFTMLFAIIDEALQLSGWGGRSFELKDIGIDWLSTLVTLSLIALVIRPKLEAVDIRLRRYAAQSDRIDKFVEEYTANLSKTDPDKLAEQICIAFKKKTGVTGGHVHFRYKGRKDSIALICDNLRLEDIIAKNKHCKSGECLVWGDSEFRRFSPKDAFLNLLSEIETIEIDHPLLKNKWTSFNEFQAWLNEIPDHLAPA